MKIEAKVGVKDLKLGMNKSQVKSLLGEPEKIEIESGGERWYFTEGFELQFYKSDLFLLGTITVSNVSARLESKKIVGLQEDELLKSFPFLSLEDDFEENGKDYVCGIREISVWVSDGIVDNITIFPEYDSTGNVPIWPSIVT